LKKNVTGSRRRRRRRSDEDIRGRMHLLQPVLSIINLAFSWYTIFTEKTLTPSYRRISVMSVLEEILAYIA
jgi:hypothetical protein